MKNSCFTEFGCFLSNLNKNQPHIYIYPLPFEPPSHLPPHPTPLGSYRAPVWVSLVIQHIPVGYFTYSNINCHATLSIHLTLASPLHIPLIFLGKYIKWGFLVFVIFFFNLRELLQVIRLYLSNEKNEIQLFATIWIDLEGLSLEKCQEEKDKCCMSLPICWV